MSFTFLWPLFLLPVIGIIILFYLLKQPAKETLISSLSFWQSLYRRQFSQKPWEKFRKDLLMFLQIFIALFLILALCAPVIMKGTKRLHVYLVFDTSGSMQALHSDGRTRLEQAKEEAKKLVSSSGSREYTIITCSSQPVITLSGSSNPIKTLSAIDKIRQQDSSGSLEAAVSFCESLSEQNPGNFLFFTDSPVTAKELPAEIYDFSVNTTPEETVSAGNLSIVNAYRFSADDDTASTGEDVTGFTVLVQNNGTSTASTDVNLYVNGELVDVRSVSVFSQDTKSANFTDIPVPKQSPVIFKAELEEKDALAKDNIYYYVYNNNTKTPKILLASRQNIFLENALKLLENCEIYKISSIKDYDPDIGYDLAVFDGIYPETLPESGSVMLFPDSSHMKKSGQAFSALLSGFEEQAVRLKNQTVSLSAEQQDEFGISPSFSVADIFSIEPPTGAQPIFIFPDKSCGCYTMQDRGRAVTVFGFDLHATDFPLQTDFPVFMYHLFLNSLSLSDFAESQVTAGNNILFYPSAIGSAVSIRNEKKKEIRRFTPSSSAAAAALDNTGIYDFYTKAIKKHAYLAVNFPSEESSVFFAPEFAPGSGHEPGKAGTIPLQKLFTILAVLFLIFEFALWLYQVFPVRKQKFFFAMRFFLLLLLCLSLADIHVTFGKSVHTTLFLVDVSDSMKRRLSSVETALKQAAENLPAGEKAGIIAFGATSSVEHFISRNLHFNGLETTPVTTATNIEAAVQTAVSMFPASDSKRIVLLTDGSENEGEVKNLASSLQEMKISLKVMEFSNVPDREVLISDVKVPKSLNVGDSFQAEVTVISNVKTNALLSLYSGDSLKSTKQVSLTAGTNRFVFQDTLTEGGLKSYRAVIETDDDTEPLNNEYLTFTKAEAPPKILFIEGKKGEGKAFEPVLQAANIPYETVTPDSAPKKPLDLKNYALILCENVHADDLPPAFLLLLPSYVSEGGGLIATGGDNSFALGNYQNSSFDKVLPVTSTLTGEKELPETAMALVIDHSGSMDGGSGRISRLSLAKEAALSALSSLRETDSIGVLAFDDAYDWVVPFTKASDTASIEYGISSIQIEGGTSIYPAVEQAVKELSKQSAKLKHIILLTDGEDGFRDYQDLYDAMEEASITLSTVAVSEGADTALLKDMAEKGNGRYYYADTSTDIPRIFSQEVFLSSKSYLINRKFTPSVGNASLLGDTGLLKARQLPPY